MSRIADMVRAKGRPLSLRERAEAVAQLGGPAPHQHRRPQQTHQDRPEYFGPAPGFVGRPMDGRKPPHWFRGYGGEVTLHYGVPVHGFYRDRSTGEWLEWGQEPQG